MKNFLLFTILLLASFCSQALTNEQKVVLQNFVATNQALNQIPHTGEGAYALSDALKVLSSPTFIVYKTSVKKSTYTNETSPIGTTFNWSGAGGYISRSQGERDAWVEVFNEDDLVNPSKSNIILAFNDIFSGSGVGAVNNRNHILSLSKRTANILEKLFATGTGSDASPAIMTIEGSLTGDELRNIMEW
jgi:hypothetical protein